MTADEERFDIRDAFNEYPEVLAAEPDQHAEMVARMRRIADELTWANRLYDYDPASGQWSPKSLRYEADYLEKHP